MNVSIYLLPFSSFPPLRLSNFIYHAVSSFSFNSPLAASIWAQLCSGECTKTCRECLISFCIPFPTLVPLSLFLTASTSSVFPTYLLSTHSQHISIPLLGAKNCLHYSPLHFTLRKTLCGTLGWATGSRSHCELPWSHGVLKLGLSYPSLKLLLLYHICFHGVGAVEL